MSMADDLDGAAQRLREKATEGEKVAEKATTKAGPVLVEYVVLERAEAAVEAGGPAWRLLGSAKARTKKAAIGEVVGNRAGAFKAVAASSWRGGEERFEQTRMESKPIEDR